MIIKKANNYIISIILLNLIDLNLGHQEVICTSQIWFSSLWSIIWSSWCAIWMAKVRVICIASIAVINNRKIMSSTKGCHSSRRAVCSTTIILVGKLLFICQWEDECLLIISIWAILWPCLWWKTSKHFSTILWFNKSQCLALVITGRVELRGSETVTGTSKKECQFAISIPHPFL